MNTNANSITHPATLAPATGLIALRVFRTTIGISDTTAWRWCRRGWIDVVNIAGTPYITAEGLARFKQRAEAGEFAKIIPGRGRRKAQPVADAI